MSADTTMEQTGISTRSNTQPNRTPPSMMDVQQSQRKRQSLKIKNVAGKRRKLIQESDEEKESPMPTQTQKQVTFRSTLMGPLTLLPKLNLRKAHLDLLKQTPFWLLIDAIRNGQLTDQSCMKRDKPVMNIIKCYNTEDKKFLIGGKKVSLTKNDIKLIFGIACGEKEIGQQKTNKSDCAFVSRRQINKRRLGSARMKELIDELLNKEEQSDEDIQDVVRLICMFIWLTIFFATSGTTITWQHVDCMENISEIKNYDWAKCIADTLHESLCRYCSRPHDTTGCVIALMYWICEHTDLVARSNQDKIPRLLNWNTSDLEKASRKVADFSKHKMQVYEGELQQTSQEIEVYSMAQPQVTYHSSQAIVEHTEPSQTQLLQGLDDIQLTEPQKTTTIQIFSPDQHLPFNSQSESGETLVPNTIQQETPPALPLYTAQHQTQYQSAQQSEHVERMKFSQGLIAKHALMTEFYNSFVQDSNEATIKELEQCIQQLQNEKDLLNKNEVVIKDERDQLAKTNDTLKIQLLEAEKQRDELKDKVQLLEIEKQTIQNNLLNKIAILKAENQKQRDELKDKIQLLESEKHTIKNDLENEIAVLDAENKKLSKLSIQPQSTTTAQEILPGVESDPTVLLTPRTEENMHSIIEAENPPSLTIDNLVRQIIEEQLAPLKQELVCLKQLQKCTGYDIVYLRFQLTALLDEIMAEEDEDEEEEEEKQQEAP